MHRLRPSFERARSAPGPADRRRIEGRARLAVWIGLSLLVLGCRSADLERRIADLEVEADRQAVARLVNLYAYGLDRGDEALLSSIFTPDAVAEYVGVDSPLNVRLEGRKAILEWLHETDRGRNPPGHYMATHVVEVEGDRAKLYAYQHNRNVSGVGFYTLDAVRTAAGWRIGKLHLDQRILDAEQVEGANDREAGER